MTKYKMARAKIKHTLNKARPYDTVFAWGNNYTEVHRVFDNIYFPLMRVDIHVQRVEKALKRHELWKK